MQMLEDKDRLTKLLDEKSKVLEEIGSEYRRVQEELEPFKSASWKEACTILRSIEIPRLLQAEHDIPLVVDGQLNTIQIAMVKGQVNEAQSLLAREEKLEEALKDLEVRMMGLRTEVEKISRKLSSDGGQQ